MLLFVVVVVEEGICKLAAWHIVLFCTAHDHVTTVFTIICAAEL